jgi:hypothetical protein
MKTLTDITKKGRKTPAFFLREDDLIYKLVTTVFSVMVLLTWN